MESFLNFLFEIGIFWILCATASFFLAKNYLNFKEKDLNQEHHKNMLYIGSYALCVSALAPTLLPTVLHYMYIEGGDVSKALGLSIVFFVLSVLITGFICELLTASGIKAYAICFFFGLLGISVGWFIGIGFANKEWIPLIINFIIGGTIILSKYLYIKKRNKLSIV